MRYKLIESMQYCCNLSKYVIIFSPCLHVFTVVDNITLFFLKTLAHTNIWLSIYYFEVILFNPSGDCVITDHDEGIWPKRLINIKGSIVKEYITVISKNAENINTWRVTNLESRSNLFEYCFIIKQHISYFINFTILSRSFKSLHSQHELSFNTHTYI